MFDIGGRLRGLVGAVGNLGNQFMARNSSKPLIKPRPSSDKKLYVALNKKGEGKKFRTEIIEKDPDKNTAYLASRELLTKEAPNLLDDGATDVLAMLAADNKKPLDLEDIHSIKRTTQKAENFSDETLDNLIKKYTSNIDDIDPVFLKAIKTEFNNYEPLSSTIPKDEPPKTDNEAFKKVQTIITKLNDIIQDGKIDGTKLNDFIGKLGNGTKTHYEASFEVLGKHKDNSFLKFLCASAAINNKTLDKEDIKLFTDSIMPKDIDTKLNKDLSETDIKTLMTHLENDKELPEELKSKFEKALTSEERKQLSNVIKSKKALTPDAIHQFCEKYMESKIHDIIKKTSNNIFDIKKILDTKDHKLDPEEIKALDKEIVGDGKEQIKKEDWDKLSDEDKHKKRLDQKLKNEFKESLPPEEREKFDKLPPEEQQKMIKEKLGGNMSPEQQLELLEQHKNARQKYQEAYQKHMQERQEGTKNLMESQIAAAQQGITGAVGAINKAVQGLTQLAGAVSQLRASTLQAAQQNSENQARASAHNQQRMQQPQQPMGGMGGYGMY